MFRRFLALFAAMFLSYLTTFSLLALNWILESWIPGVILLFICIYYLFLDIIFNED